MTTMAAASTTLNPFPRFFPERLLPLTTQERTFASTNSTATATVSAGAWIKNLQTLPWVTFAASSRTSRTPVAGGLIRWQIMLPQQLTTAISEDTSTAPSTFNVGAVLKPEHANNYDVLYERYLTPLGLVQAGFFYKSITAPIVTNVTLATLGPFAGHFVAIPANAGTAYVTGLEVAFQQHFTYLPGLLGGLGVSANYSYTTSGTTKVDPLRTDNPALLRQAPNTWNISPTYDRRRLSLRVGLAYNGPNIFQNFPISVSRSFSQPHTTTSYDSEPTAWWHQGSRW